MSWLLIVVGLVVAVVSYVVIYRAQRASGIAGMRGTGGLENLDVPGWTRPAMIVGLLLLVVGVVVLFV